MPSLAEIVRALTGSVRVALRDPDAHAWFNISIEGFWRSFFAFVLVVPFFLIVAAAGSGPDAPGGGLATPLRLVVHGVEWVAFPLAMVFVTRLLGVQDRYIAYIIVYNWSSVPAMAVMMPPFLLYALGLIGAQGVTTFALVLTVGIAYYRWLIARAVLEVAGPAAAGIVVFDFAVSILAGTAAQRLLGA